MSDPDALIGKHVLIGVTYLDADENVVDQIQVHGDIHSIDDDAITIVHTDTGEEFMLPPDTKSLMPADPGEYRLRGSGEIVVNPDLISTWTVYAPPDSGPLSERKT